MMKSMAKHSLFEVADDFELDVSWRENGNVNNALIEPPIFDQLARIYQQSIAGKCRQRLVRRIPVSGWTKRQGLPKRLARVMKEVDKRARLSAKIADAERRRQ